MDRDLSSHLLKRKPSIILPNIGKSRNSMVSIDRNMWQGHMMAVMKDETG